MTAYIVRGQRIPYSTARQRLTVPEVEALTAKIESFIDRQPGLRRRMDGPQDTSDLVRLYGLEAIGEDHRTRHRQWWKAVRMVLTTCEGDLPGFTWLGRQALRAACLLCMLTPRRPIRDAREIKGRMAGHHRLDMGSWDHATLYAGWSAMCLSFHVRQFRYEIYSDGDWCM